MPIGRPDDDAVAFGGAGGIEGRRVRVVHHADEQFEGNTGIDTAIRRGIGDAASGLDLVERIRRYRFFPGTGEGERP